jgi:hypothetical protein
MVPADLGYSNSLVHSVSIVYAGAPNPPQVNHFPRPYPSLHALTCPYLAKRPPVNLLRQGSGLEAAPEPRPVLPESLPGFVEKRAPRYPQLSPQSVGALKV